MKLGFVSAILDGVPFEKVIDIASDLNFQCVEMACWPRGKAERRYAGVSHIDVDNLTADQVKHVQDYCNSKNVQISSLAYYPNPMDGDLEKREFNINHLKKVIDASQKLDVNMVTTFIGRDQFKSVEENLLLFREIWPPIIKYAEERNVRIGIENCPMLFGAEQWPGGQNLATTPKIWREMFDIIPSNHFGLNFDPSHFVWQMMDYIQPIYEFSDKLFHIHFKDVKILSHQLNQVGIMAYPLAYMSPKLPGLGDVDWGKFVSALTDVGYDSFACIEVEDRSFEGSFDKVLDSLKISSHYLSQYVI